MWCSGVNSDFESSTGSRPDGERESGGPVGLGHVTNQSEVKLLMLDSELKTAFVVFLGNLRRKEKLSALVGWRMVYSSTGSRWIDDGKGPSQGFSWRQDLTPYISSSFCPGVI